MIDYVGDQLLRILAEPTYPLGGVEPVVRGGTALLIGVELTLGEVLFSAGNHKWQPDLGRLA